MENSLEEYIKTLSKFTEIEKNAEKDERTAQEKFEEEKYENMKQDRILRNVFSYLIFALICGFLASVITLLYLCGYKDTYLSDSVLITLLGTTTATVLGLFVIVAKYLFHNSDISNNQ